MKDRRKKRERRKKVRGRRRWVDEPIPLTF
jgi:hypothetical protein